MLAAEKQAVEELLCEVLEGEDKAACLVGEDDALLLVVQLVECVWIVVEKRCSLGTVAGVMDMDLAVIVGVYVGVGALLNELEEAVCDVL